MIRLKKKPLFHFLPSSLIYSIATVGCNFRCLFCQNADISQASKQGFFFNSTHIPGEETTPEQIVSRAIKANCQSVAYTYTEPTIFVEFALETIKLARKRGLKNVWASNGYMSKETRSAILPYLDAINIDLKSFANEFYRRICGAQVEPILDNLQFFKKKNVWVEVTTLIIPGQNDQPEMFRQIASFIKNKLGAETPWHVTAFYPAFKMTDTPPTSPNTLLTDYQIGRKVGLKYVYTGNISGLEFEVKGNKASCYSCGYSLEVII